MGLYTCIPTEILIFSNSFPILFYNFFFFFYFILLFYFILNTQFLHSFEKFSNYRNYLETDEKYRLIKIVDGLNYPWGMTFIDDEHLLITEKKGSIYSISFCLLKSFRCGWPLLN